MNNDKIKIEFDNTKVLKDYKANVERINRIQQDLWHLQNDNDMFISGRERINDFMNFLECIKTDLFEMIANIEEPDKKHYFTTVNIRWSTLDNWRDHPKAKGGSDLNET